MKTSGIIMTLHNNTFIKSEHAPFKFTGTLVEVFAMTFLLDYVVICWSTQGPLCCPDQLRIYLADLHTLQIIEI